VVSDRFDQGYDSPGQSRNRNRARTAGDPYAGDTAITQRQGVEREESDAAKGDADSEAALRYEDHARLRMQARREGYAKKTDEYVDSEDHLEQATSDYTAWRDKKIKNYLADNIDTHATDHSTIMTNGMHAQKALAYDVAVGLCQIRDEDLHTLRKTADWRFMSGLDKSDPHSVFAEYFELGRINDVSPDEWANAPGSTGGMPGKIVDRREHGVPQSHPRQGGHP
jgi:hypothetical protein